MELADSQRQPRNPLVEGLSALCYSAVVEPVRGIAQIVDHYAPTHADAAVKSLASRIGIESHDAGSSGSLVWGAEQLGHAAGMMLPFMGTLKGVRAVNALALGERAAYATALDVGASRSLFGLALTDATQSAIAGGINGSLLQASNQNNVKGEGFWGDRGNAARSQMELFGALSFGNMYLRSGLGRIGTAFEKTSLPALIKTPLRTTLNSPVLTGVLAGAPLGALSAEIGAWQNGKPYASWNDVKQSAAGMMLFNGVFASAGWLGEQRGNSNTTNARHLTNRLGLTAAGSDPAVQKEFRIVQGRAALDQLYRDTASGADRTVAQLTVRQKLDGVLSSALNSMLGTKFSTYGPARSMLVSHQSSGELNFAPGTTDLIATCARLAPSLRSRHVFAGINEDLAGSAPVWLSPGRTGTDLFRLTRSRPTSAEVDPNFLDPVQLGRGRKGLEEEARDRQAVIDTANEMMRKSGTNVVSSSALIDATGVTRDTVRKYLDEAVEKGLVQPYELTGRPGRVAQGKANEEAILLAVKKAMALGAKEISTTDLVKRTGLSQGTVLKGVNHWVESGELVARKDEGRHHRFFFRLADAHQTGTEAPATSFEPVMPSMPSPSRLPRDRQAEDVFNRILLMKNLRQMEAGKRALVDDLSNYDQEHLLQPLVDAGLLSVSEDTPHFYRPTRSGSVGLLTGHIGVTNTTIGKNIRAALEQDKLDHPQSPGLSVPELSQATGKGEKVLMQHLTHMEAEKSVTMIPPVMAGKPASLYRIAGQPLSESDFTFGDVERRIYQALAEYSAREPEGSGLTMNQLGAQTGLGGKSLYYGLVNVRKIPGVESSKLASSHRPRLYQFSSDYQPARTADDFQLPAGAALTAAERKALACFLCNFKPGAEGVLGGIPPAKLVLPAVSNLNVARLTNDSEWFADTNLRSLADKGLVQQSRRNPSLWMLRLPQQS